MEEIPGSKVTNRRGEDTWLSLDEASVNLPNVIIWYWRPARNIVKQRSAKVAVKASGLSEENCEINNCKKWLLKWARSSASNERKGEEWSTCSDIKIEKKRLGFLTDTPCRCPLLFRLIFWVGCTFEGLAGDVANSKTEKKTPHLNQPQFLWQQVRKFRNLWLVPAAIVRCLPSKKRGREAKKNRTRVTRQDKTRQDKTRQGKKKMTLGSTGALHTCLKH